MNTTVTQEQIDFYRENGFVVLHDFLTPEELETWRDAVDGAVRRRGERRQLHHKDNKYKGTYYDYIFVQRVNLWMDSPEVRRLILDPRLGRLAAELAGVDGMRIWHDQALIKQPWANPTGWHLDNPKWSYSSRHTLSIWVALDDATLQNGCLYFLPGSHKTADYDDVPIGENIGDIFRVYPEWQETMSASAEMKAGSCSFHNGLIAHGAGANMTPGWRRAMTCGFMPDGCTFNGKQNILTDEQFASYEIGDLLDDDFQNPLIYHRTKPYADKLAERFAEDS